MEVPDDAIPIRRRRARSLEPAPQPKSGIRARTIGENFAAPRAAKPKSKSLKSTSRQHRERDAQESRERREQGDWQDARPGHLVALYAACHEKVYGFAPVEFDTGKDYTAARLAAGRMLRTEFQANAPVMVEFIRWTWRREESREKWRRERNQGGYRLGWRLQFNGSLLSDYRLDLARHKGKP